MKFSFGSVDTKGEMPPSPAKLCQKVPQKATVNISASTLSLNLLLTFDKHKKIML